MIVFCHLLNDTSGSPTVLHSTINALEVYEKRLLFIGSQGRGVLEETNVPIRRYWYRRSHRKFVTLFTYFASQIFLYRALSRARDIPVDATIFVNTLLPFGAMLWGRRTGRRVIVHIHEVYISPKLFRCFLKACAALCADKVLYVSQDHSIRMPIVGPTATVVYNPVSPLLIKAAESVNYVPQRSGAFEVLMLASIRGYKGIKEFMALALALRDREDILFTLVLNAEDSEVNDLRKCHPDAKNVSFHPRVKNPCAFYAGADLLLNLSRTDQCIETFGLTLIEAMTFGVPVIAPPVGGPREIISDGIEGYCIDSRDSAALQAAVLELADNPKRSKEMSKAALLRAKDFTYDNYAVALQNALKC
tara:strand:- start:2303 stop:3388 length:1086 start_codon:yes stop_codon:yes gene_type:complete